VPSSPPLSPSAASPESAGPEEEVVGHWQTHSQWQVSPPPGRLVVAGTVVVVIAVEVDGTVEEVVSSVEVGCGTVEEVVSSVEVGCGVDDGVGTGDGEGPGAGGSM